MTCGIYILKFKGTDKVYIGMSDNIERRWSGHKYSLTKGKCSEKLLQAFTTYGEPTLEILCECSKSELDSLEKEAIQIYDSITNGFNSRDGGAVGAGISISGEGNGRSKYTNEQIEECFKLLCTTDMTHKEISEQTKVSAQAISHISCGSGHKWLATKYPVEHHNLINRNRPAHKQFNITSILDTTNNTEHQVSSYKEIQELTGCAYSSAVSLVSGQLAKLFNRWTLKTPAKRYTIKKKRYTLEHASTKSIVEVYSKTKFFTEYGLINKRKFCEFLEAGAIGSTYQDWKLVSIS